MKAKKKKEKEANRPTEAGERDANTKGVNGRDKAELHLFSCQCSVIIGAASSANMFRVQREVSNTL